MALVRNGGYLHRDEEQTVGAFIEDITKNWPNNNSKRTNYIVKQAINEWKKFQFATDNKTKTHLLQTIQLAQSAPLCENC